MRVYVRWKFGERLNDECVLPTMKYSDEFVIVCECFRGREGWRFDSGQGNHEKSISFDFAKTYYSIWFTHNWKKVTFQQDNNPKYTSKVCQNYHVSKKMVQNFRKYNFTTSLGWSLSHWISTGWIGLESLNRTPKKREWAFTMLEECLGRSAIYFFFQSKPVGNNAKKL